MTYLLIKGVVIVQTREVHVKEYRKKNGLLQKEMADMLGVTERQYRRIEKGVCSPDVWDIIRIADRLGVKDIRLLWSCSS